MSSFVVVVTLCIGLVSGDVSHLKGYQYVNPGANLLATSALEPHNLDSTSLQYQRPNSYVPPASGNPFTQYDHQRYTTGLKAPAPPTNSATNYYQQPTVVQRPASQQAAVVQRTEPQQPTAQRIAPQQPAVQQRYASNIYQYTQSQLQQRYASQQPATSLPPIITKHVYFHIAPEEPEEKSGPRYVQLGRARKNYKIIFIKAPTYGSNSPIIPILPQNEEKTIVYVLSKKPDAISNIQLPEQPVTEPTKPEVFFIKYKTQQEAEQAQQKIQAVYDTANVSGGQVPQIDIRGDEIAASGNNAQFVQQPQQSPAQYFQQTNPVTATPSTQYASTYSANQNYLPPRSG